MLPDVHFLHGSLKIWDRTRNLSPALFFRMNTSFTSPEKSTNIIYEFEQRRDQMKLEKIKCIALHQLLVHLVEKSCGWPLLLRIIYSDWFWLLEHVEKSVPTNAAKTVELSSVLTRRGSSTLLPQSGWVTELEAVFGMDPKRRHD